MDEPPPLENLSGLIKKKKQLPPQAPKEEIVVKEPPRKEFQGLRKGFFDQKPQKQTKIPYIEPKKTKQDSLRLDQVTQNMAAHLDQTRQEWMTPQFLDKLEKSPVLLKALNDPGFAIACQEMAQNPQKAFEKYQSKPEWINALREFSGFLGEALEQKEDKLPKHEQQLVDRECLKDPDVQRVLVQLQQKPLFNEIMSRQKPETRSKIQLLMQAGLLQIQR
ncbi:hypothetical protein EDD86DRAFT_248583 [Gorgonomyces haynaldii]|nr:hypothetical protein EDD86DRAFT_248583 [Gorgonomyces haynaldii]